MLVFWVQLLVLFGTARLLGELMRRIGQPAVIGELGAGLVLGPSVLERIFPAASEWLFPADGVQTAMLFTVGWLGVVLLLLATGFETDLGLVRSMGWAAAFVSTGSLVLPLILGFAVGMTMPNGFIGEGDRGVFALFMAAALSISSLPVIAKILAEMGFIRRNFGQLTLAAGMANDVVGWILLGVIAGLAQAGNISAGPVLGTVFGVGLFFLFALTIGQRGLDLSLERLRRGGASTVATATVVLGVTLAAGVATQALGVEAVLGAFVAGIMIGRSRIREEQVIHQIETVTASFFAPVFFATAGLRVDLGLLAEADVLFWGGVVIAVASLSKFFGAVLGAMAARIPGREGAALGVGLNARGALEIVIATVGLAIGILNQASYTVVVLMAMATSMMTPPALRAVLAGWEGTEEELERLRQEERKRTNLVVRGGRILLPTQGGPNSILAAQVADLAWPQSAEVAAMSVGEEPPDVRFVLDVFGERQGRHVHVSGAELVDTVIDEAVLGYDAIAIGGTYRDDLSDLITPVVDALLVRSPVPVVLVRRPRTLDRRTVPAFARAIVPMTGTPSSRAAQELAFNMSARIGTDIVLTHVSGTGDDVRRPARAGVGALTRNRIGTAAVTERLAADALAVAEDLGARARTLIVESDSIADAIIEASRDEHADLVMLGVSRREVEGHLFLGHTAEDVLARCDATVALVVMPPQVTGNGRA